MYKITLQDQLRVSCGSQVVERFRTRKAASLLAYLALYPGNHSREKLLELFWPESELDAARNQLSTTLSYLRAPLERELNQPFGALIVANRDWIGLREGGYTTDWTSLPSRLDPERLLPGFYDDFVLEAREVLRRQQESQIRPPGALAIQPLPADLTPYLGREDLKHQVETLLTQTRLLTLTGTGGVGKTRLALEMLRQHASQGHTVAWVELSSLRSQEGVVLRIATALGLHRPEEVVSALRETPVLLALDNCEHLIFAVAQECERLLRACPSLTVLATSREPLNIPGETLLRLPGLTEAESALLFCERGRQARPGWELTRDERPLLSLLCLRLDGLPLALELAAAKLRTHSLMELVQRLEARLALLTQGSRVAEPRQQTLRAAISWSYDLLTPAERTLFAALAVFHGGWTSEQAVLLRGSEPNTLELLDQLVEKSLVQAEYLEHGMRYRFLETIREFATECLAALPPAAQESLHRAHLHLFFTLVRESYQYGSEQILAWSRLLDPEQANIERALETCFFLEPTQALEFCGLLFRYWARRAQYPKAIGFLTRSLALPYTPETPPKHRNYAVLSLARAYQRTGEWDKAHTVLDLLLPESQTLYEQVETLEERAMALFNLSRFTEARALFETALQLATTDKENTPYGRLLANYSQLMVAEGELADARRLIEECRSWFRRNWADESLAVVRLLEGELKDVRTTILQAIKTDVANRLYREVGYQLCHLAMVTFREGNSLHAARLYGACDAWCSYYGYRLEQPEHSLQATDRAHLRTELGELVFAEALTLGTSWEPEQILTQLD